MNPKQAVASEIRHFLEIFRNQAKLEEFRGLTEIEQQLASVGSLEQAAADAEKRLATAATAEMERKAAQEDAQAVRAEAGQTANKILDQARADANRLVSEAKAEAEQIKADARAFREAEHEKARLAQHLAKATVGGHQEELEKIAAVRAECAEIEASARAAVAEARAERDRLQQETDVLSAKLK